ncbi:MAG: VirB4 family type IV secretion/conjugal transfer ATPase [Rickettsiales bacterium]
MFKLNLKKIRTNKQKFINNEYSATNFLPYICHYNSNTLLMTEGRLMRVIKVKGFSFETADDEDLENKKSLRNALFKGMGSGSFSMMFHTIRRRQRAYPDGNMPNLFSQYADEEWRYRHGDKHSFINEHYVTIIRKKDKSTTALLGNVLKAIEKKTDKNAWIRELQDNYDELDEMTDRMLNAYASYGAELLGTKNTKNGPFSEILEFLGSLINCGYRQPIQVPASNIAKILPNHRLFFGPKAIEARGVLGSRYAGIVSLKEHKPYTHAGMLDGFLKLPYEFIISQNFNFIDRSSAISSMQLQQNRLQQAEDIAKSQIMEISEALDIAMSGEIAFGHHSLQILCVEDSVKSLENALSLAVVEFANIGINAVRERINLEPAYWGQLPGNDEFLVRKANINTLNLASFASFHNFPSGKRSGNHWGNAVTVFNTTSGTPFFFNFHSRDVGHSTIIGPTGAGKTVLMNFLCLQAQKFNPRTFFFDKDRGAEIFIKAIDGVHFFLDPGHETGFNPLQLPDTNDNRNFLMDWLRSLVTGKDMPPLTPEDIDTIKDAIVGNYKLPQKDRRLSNIAAFMGMGGPGSLASRLAMWHGNGSHAKLFDNLEDRLDFSKAASFGFEMNNILKDQYSIGPVLLYLFHKINISLDGRPTLIILDEAWALIDNEVFAPKIKDWLKVMRKLNAMVVFATQSVEDAANSDISDTLIQQTATQIFLPNLKATSLYKDVFMLSEREYQIIKTTDPSSRFFLVKQGNDSVVSRIDLQGMDDIINVLSGRAETVKLLDEIIIETGDNAEEWLPVFFEKVAKL